MKIKIVEVEVTMKFAGRLELEEDDNEEQAVWHKVKSSRAIPPSKRFRILQRDGFTGQYCGGTPQEGYILHVDHRIPFSKGGTHDDDNLVTACWLCNTGKQ